MDLSEIKRVEVDILKHVKNICILNNLKYYLAGGTLIGAIRHKGFIPWDDDIDIYMPREDYMKLISIMEKDCNDTYGIMVPFAIGADIHYPFAKVVDNRTILKELSVDNLKDIGVCIDVFPIDGVKDSFLLKESLFFCIYILKQIQFCFICHTNLKKTSTFLSNLVKVLITITIKQLSEHQRHKISVLFGILVDKVAKSNSINDCEKVANLVWGYGKREICSKAAFARSIEVEFEGENFAAPVGYHEYLTNVYGDYMSLPPVDQRIAHQIKAYWR